VEPPNRRLEAPAQLVAVEGEVAAELEATGEFLILHASGSLKAGPTLVDVESVSQVGGGRLTVVIVSGVEYPGGPVSCARGNRAGLTGAGAARTTEK
jgi:hypothetical protein